MIRQCENIRCMKSLQAIYIILRVTLAFGLVRQKGWEGARTGATSLRVSNWMVLLGTFWIRRRGRARRGMNGLCNTRSACLR
jgi:hypothetical protein